MCKRADIEWELKQDQRVNVEMVLHVERKNEYGMARMVLMAEAGIGQVRCTPWLG